jgi:hypothetical protein
MDKGRWKVKGNGKWGMGKQERVRRERSGEKPHCQTMSADTEGEQQVNKGRSEVGKEERGRE